MFGDFHEVPIKKKHEGKIDAECMFCCCNLNVIYTECSIYSANGDV